jgi:hypothetical protein
MRRPWLQKSGDSNADPGTVNRSHKCPLRQSNSIAPLITTSIVNAAAQLMSAANQVFNFLSCQN